MNFFNQNSTYAPIPGNVITSTDGNNIPLDIETVRLMNNILNRQEFAPLLGEVSWLGDLGLAVFKIATLTPIFKFDGKILARYTPQLDNIQVAIDIAEGVEYNLPLIDFQRIKFSGEVISRWEDHMSFALSKRFDMEAAQFLITAANPNTDPDMIVYLDDNSGKFGELTPQEAKDLAFSNFYNVSIQGPKFMKYVDKYTFGVGDLADFRLIMDPVQLTNLSFSVALNNYSEKALESFVQGKLPMGTLGQFPVPVIQSILMDQFFGIATDTEPTVSGDREYDFRNVLGVLIHNDAFVQPRKVYDAGTWKNEVRDPVVYTKALYGMGLIRPKLLKLFVRKGATYVPATDTVPAHWTLPNQKTLFSGKGVKTTTLTAPANNPKGLPRS